jgi:hypothetical protein
MALGVVSYNESERAMLRGEFWSGAVWDGASFALNLGIAALCFWHNRVARTVGPGERGCPGASILAVDNCRMEGVEEAKGGQQKDGELPGDGVSKSK